MLAFFTASWPGRVLLALLGIVAVVVVVALVGFLLAVTGGPGACTPGGGPVTVSQVQADAFQTKWRTFEDTLDGGSRATVTFTESEITSRAKERLDEVGRDVRDLRVCVRQGRAEATAKLDPPGFADVQGKVEGSVDLTTPHPVVRIDDVSMGNVPGLLMEPFEGLLERAFDEVLENVDLEHHAYTITYAEGTVRIDAEP